MITQCQSVVMACRRFRNRTTSTENRKTKKTEYGEPKTNKKNLVFLNCLTSSGTNQGSRQMFSSRDENSLHFSFFFSLFSLTLGRNGTQTKTLIHFESFLAKLFKGIFFVWKVREQANRRNSNRPSCCCRCCFFGQLPPNLFFFH